MPRPQPLILIPPSEGKTSGDFEHPLGYRFDPAATTQAGTLTNAVLRQQG